MLNDPNVTQRLENVTFVDISSFANPYTEELIPDENSVKFLKEMGFQEDQCERALIIANNYRVSAMEILLSDEQRESNVNNQLNYHIEVDDFFDFNYIEYGNHYYI
jgi:uncharacterized UBP type Zn finger protein